MTLMVGLCPCGRAVPLEQGGSKKGGDLFCLKKIEIPSPHLRESTTYPRTLHEMPCYICLEEEGNLLQANGCACKGSVEIHHACLQEWINTAENPFQCSVCKSDYSGTFVNQFLSMEEIMFHCTEEQRLEEMDDMNAEVIEVHGMMIIQTEDEYIFETEEQRTLYNQLYDREFRSLKQENRQKHIHAKKQSHQPRQARRHQPMARSMRR